MRTSYITRQERDTRLEERHILFQHADTQSIAYSPGMQSAGAAFA